jgi:hypothetical protein
MKLTRKEKEMIALALLQQLAIEQGKGSSVKVEALAVELGKGSGIYYEVILDVMRSLLHKEPQVFPDTNPGATALAVLSRNFSSRLNRTLAENGSRMRAQIEVGAAFLQANFGIDAEKSRVFLKELFLEAIITSFRQALA